jgi:hypothetical protein
MRAGIQALKNVLKSGAARGRIRPAQPGDLKRAAKAGFPRELLAFYRKYEPDPRDGCVELDQRIYCIADALRLNREVLPVVDGIPHGFAVFGGSASGDVYCFDTNVTTEERLHPVVWFRREVIAESTDISFLWAYRVEVASSLDDFLLKFTSRSLHSEPSPPELTWTVRKRAGKVTGMQALKDAVKSAGRAGRIRPATPRDLQRAEKAGFPRELLRFYKRCEPDPRDGYVELDQRLYCIARALRENRKELPGVALFPHGYVVFAGTTAGDPYCIDTNVKSMRNHQAIVLFSHEDKRGHGCRVPAGSQGGGGFVPRRLSCPILHRQAP